MKKILILFVGIIILICGCEDVLDKEAMNAVDEDDVWVSEDLVNMYLNGVYGTILPSFAGTSNTGVSTESTGSGTGNMLFGKLSDEASYGIFSSSTYNDIRELNILIDRMHSSTLDEDIINEIYGQAYFLRGYQYWELIKYYGGVPIILHAEDPFDYESLLVSRDYAKDCIEQIVSDLDSAIMLLPDEWDDSERGRATRGAAAALKGRVLLFYASPQFNPDDLSERWDDAYTANQEAVEICEADGYELYDDFENIFINESKCNEDIFITVYDGSTKSHGYDDNVRPRSFSNSSSSASNEPTWEFVKSFPMADGTPIDESDEYDSTYFWKNRDPRFYATIAYNGCEWEFEGGESGRRQWTYFNNTEEPSSSLTGTGFYCRKNVDETIKQTETPEIGTDWIEIRLAEVYLNFAECAAETGQTDEAKNMLTKIRERAGIEAGDGSYGITARTPDEMVEAVMLERQLEFAFEDKRHWDLRRRNMYITDLNETPMINGTRRHGLEFYLDTAYIRSIDPNVSADSVYTHFEEVIADTLDFDADYDKFFYVEYIDLDTEEINFLQPKYNFYFIPSDCLEKNANLQQTIYWGDSDTFDPLGE